MAIKIVSKKNTPKKLSNKNGFKNQTKRGRGRPKKSAVKQLTEKTQNQVQKVIAEIKNELKNNPKIDLATFGAKQIKALINSKVKTQSGDNKKIFDQISQFRRNQLRAQNIERQAQLAKAYQDQAKNACNVLISTGDGPHINIADQEMENMQINYLLQEIEKQKANMLAVQKEKEALKTENENLKKELKDHKKKLAGAELKNKTRMEEMKNVRNLINDLIKNEEDPTTWSARLETWLSTLRPHIPGEQSGGGYKATTITAYKNQLRPWVKYLDEHKVEPSNLIIRQYVKEKYPDNIKNQNHLGQAITRFCNQYLNTALEFKKQILKNQPPKMHKEISETDLQIMKSHVRNKLATFNKKAHNELLTNAEIAKYLAIYFVIITGCRPNEAAHIVYNKLYKKRTNSIYERWGKINYIIEMNQDYTKTAFDYKWYLQSKDDIFINVLRDLDLSDFQAQFTLLATLDYWFEKVCKESGVSQSVRGDRISMRSIRCYHATQWVQTCAEYRALNLPLACYPLNPLQHTTGKQTMKTYAHNKADDPELARERAFKKYPDAKEILQAQGFVNKRNRNGNNRKKIDRKMNI